jgi:hydroxyacylglutathione hydrolase
MMRFLILLSVLGLLSAPSPAGSAVVAGAPSAPSNPHQSARAAAPERVAHPPAPLQAQAYNPSTFILRESLCATAEAPFMYLLIGSTRALLVDTGDVADPNLAPLMKTVTNLLPRRGSFRMPLLVVHTHRHLDHRAGDAQFAQAPNVQVVGFDLDSVRRYYNFSRWPQGAAEIDLGGRAVDVIPTPGHNETHLAFYDQKTALVLSGDFMMPGRLTFDDDAAELASARRVAAFVKDRPVSHVLGGHIERDDAGELFPQGARVHPHEAALAMSKADLLALPAAVAHFNGFYSRDGRLTLSNPTHTLMALGFAVAAAVVALASAAVLWLGRRGRDRRN